MTEDENFKKDLELAIKKNLPAQTSDVLQKVLKQAETDSKLVITLNEQLEKLKKNNLELCNRVEEYQKFDERNSKLEAREKAVIQEEMNIKIFVLEYQLGSEKEKNEFSKEILRGLVRNIEYRKNTFDSQSGPDGRDQFGNQTYATHTKNFNTTEEAK